MPAPDAMLFDFSDSDWHFGLAGAVKMANAYPSDHDTGRLVWAHEGRNKDTLSKFFQDLGEFQIRCVDACVGRRRGVDPRGGERARTAGGALPGSVFWRPPDYADVVARSAGGGGIAAPTVGVIIAVDTAQAGELIDQPGGRTVPAAR